jgi:hypothetical protein
VLPLRSQLPLRTFAFAVPLRTFAFAVAFLLSSRRDLLLQLHVPLQSQSSLPFPFDRPPKK